MFEEEWQKALDNHEVQAALLIDLTKAFEAMSHDILVAKRLEFVKVTGTSLQQSSVNIYYGFYAI